MTRLLFIFPVLSLAACPASGPGGTSGGTGTGAGTSSGGSTGGHGGVLCSGDLECASGQCLGGRCCASHCLVPDGSCGATACLADGGCDYPGTSVGCGGGTCDVSNRFTPPKTCDGAGTCHDPGSQDCGGFTCLGNVGCPDHCIDDTVCFPGTHCFPKQRICCPPIPPGSTVYVDCQAGADTGCCGSGPGAAACLTLTAAMDAVDRSHATGAVLVAQVGVAGGGDWTAPESWPVVLHRGVTLDAPGVFFFVPDSSQFVLDVFDVAPLDVSDQLPVTLTGDPGNPLYVGFDQNAGQSSNTYDGLLVRGLTASVSNLWIGGTANGAQIEEDGVLEIDGPVRFGGYESPSHVGFVPSNHGIVCGGSATKPANLDDPGARNGELIFQGLSQAGLYVLPNCSVALNHRPIFGMAPVDGGCPNPKPDLIGILVDADPGQVTIEGAVLQCMAVDGVQLISGTAEVTLDDATITHCGCTGLRAFAGSIYSNAGRILHNYRGVAQVGGQIVLSGGGTGGAGGGNTIGCNDGTEPGACQGGGAPGADVVNESADPLDADNCLFDHAPPSELSCTDATFANCTCVSLPSTPCPSADGVDLVSTSTGIISSAGSGANALICN